jgi:hypothetical protein
MNRDDVIRMARAAGFKPEFFSPEGIDMWEHFAQLVAAKEREACAKIAQDFAKKWWGIHCHSNKHMETTRKAHEDFCKIDNAIRARGDA